MSTEIDLHRLRELIDAYGAEPYRWPESERKAAQALLDDSTQARQWLDRARATDALLDRAVVSPAPRALRERLLARTPQRIGWRPALAALWRDLGGWNLAGPALAAGMALGVGLGVGVSPLPAANGFDEDTLYRLAGLDADADSNELWIDEP